MGEEHPQGGLLLDVVLLHLRLLGEELGALSGIEADVEPDRGQDDAEEERHMPPPGLELVAGNCRCGCNSGGAEQEPTGHADLRPGPVETSPALGCVLDRDDHRPSPFAADGEPLLQSKNAQQDGRTTLLIAVDLLARRAGSRRVALDFRHSPSGDQLLAPVVAPDVVKQWRMMS